MRSQKFFEMLIFAERLRRAQERFRLNRDGGGAQKSLRGRGFHSAILQDRNAVFSGFLHRLVVRFGASRSDFSQIEILAPRQFRDQLLDSRNGLLIADFFQCVQYREGQFRFPQVDTLSQLFTRRFRNSCTITAPRDL